MIAATRSPETQHRAAPPPAADPVEELALANADLRSVIESAQIAIVVLDPALCIRTFTPAIQLVIPIDQAHRGRPIAELAHTAGYPDLAEDARLVLGSHRAVERQASHPATGAHYLVRLLPHYGAAGVVDGVVVTFLDITAAYQAEQARRASDERFRRMAAAVPALLFIASADLAWDYVNPPYYALTGQAGGAALGTGWHAALHPDDLAANEALWVQARDAGGVMEQEARLRRADGRWCWFLMRAVPQLDEAGKPVRWYGSCTDINERRLAEAKQGMLLAELQHRIKNILAVVRSVLTRTLQSSTDLDHFATHLAGRIGALARTFSVSARTAEGLVVLEELVYQEVAAHGGQDERKIHVEGPLVSLPAKMADPIGLAIHELTTNSIKYGALATPNGRVRVTWWLGRDAGMAGDRLFLEWQESGVPLTDLKPTRHGFGRELIEQGLPYELGAHTTLEFRPGGLHCAIAVDLPAADRSGGTLWAQR